MTASQFVTPEYHRTRFVHDPHRAIVWRHICDYLRRWVAPDAPLLDLGAGYGDVVRFLGGTEAIALDANPEMVPHWPRGVRPVIQMMPAPLPIDDSVLGTVVSSNFFEHFTTEQCVEIFAEVRRALRPAGRLIAIQPNFRLQPYRYFDDYTHKTPFTDDGFADFLAATGWRVIHREPRFLPFSMKSRLPKWGWLVPLYLSLPYRPAAGQFLVVAESTKT